jgi:hypothetical protein
MEKLYLDELSEQMAEWDENVRGLSVNASIGLDFSWRQRTRLGFGWLQALKTTAQK